MKKIFVAIALIAGLGTSSVAFANAKTTNEISIQLNVADYTPIEVKRPPHYDGWECAITFNGKDVSTKLNQDLCLFLEEFEDKRNEVKDYQTSLESYQKWQDKTLAYYANAKLTEKETEEISNEERIRRFQKIMNERYGKKES